MCRQFNLGLNERLGYAFSAKDTSSQCVLWLLCWIMALIMWPCLVWKFRDASALVWPLTGSAQSLRVLSQRVTSLSPYILLFYPWTLPHKKPFLCLYVGANGDFTFCMRHTLHLSCHKHSHNSLTRRDKQLTPSIKGLVIVGENKIKYLHIGLGIENVWDGRGWRHVSLYCGQRHIKYKL